MDAGQEKTNTARTPIAANTTLAGTVTRFAPSPTGFLHVGHAYSALFAWRAAREAGGNFLLRIEDIDATRCRAEFAEAIESDLAWLGSDLEDWDWQKPVRVQSQHMNDYKAALGELDRLGLVYPCFCTRARIMAEVASAGAAPHGAEGPVYPRTCRALSPREREARIESGVPFALRIDMARAAERAGALYWHDRAAGHVRARPESHGDVVLARKETPTSYHLSVTVDDHLQGVTLVTRGEDLFAATHVHRLLQSLLGLNTPDYHHHPLLTDETGRRLAKRDQALTLRALRQAGFPPAEVRRMAGFAEDESPGARLDAKLGVR